MSIFCFLHNFEMACSCIGIHERATLCLFQHSTNHPVKGAVANRMRAIEDENVQRDKQLISYDQVVNYLLATFGIVNVIDKSDAGIATVKQSE